MNDISILIGGKAGFGIDTSSLIIARIFNQLGYRLYVYRDYPSLIRGGHTFSIIRAHSEKKAAHSNRIDILLALDQDTLDFHKSRLNKNGMLIYDSDSVNAEGIGDGIQTIKAPLTTLVKEENASEIMRNTCIIGVLCKICCIRWDILEKVLKKNISRETDLNLKVARRGFDAVEELRKAEPLNQAPLPIISGNEAIGLGLLKAGIQDYVAYPMTPSSGLLHFMASLTQDFPLKVIHPESEIGVMLMALGFSFMGEKTAVGTSGGGFCLMTEGLSFAGMAELPVVIIMGQRPGPSTGLPTYTSQTELDFVISAGQGEFPRLVVAPADAEEAYYWSGLAMNLAWKFQIPSFILSDKTLSEGAYSFDLNSVPEIREENPVPWDKKSPYKRYADTETGVSPLAFVPQPNEVIKANSYEHDALGITTEDAVISKAMQDKRMRKERFLREDLENYRTVNIYGDNAATTAIVCWGSNKGVCAEAAEKLKLKVIQPVVLWPFPLKAVKEALSGVTKIISVENNATGQLAGLMSRYGLIVNEKILRYDGRPFVPEELEEEIRKVMK